MNDLMPGLTSVPNVHPLFVHFPITLWTVALGFCAFGLLRSRIDIFRVGRWLLYLGTLGAAVAVATGLWAEEELGHSSPGHAFVHVHRNYMLVALALGAVTTVAAFVLRRRESKGALSLLTLGLAITVAVTTLGADRGAALVYGHGVGVSVDMMQMDGGGGGHGHDHGGMQPSHGEPTPPSGQVAPAASRGEPVNGDANLPEPATPAHAPAQSPSVAMPSPRWPAPKPSTPTSTPRSSDSATAPARTPPSQQSSERSRPAPTSADHDTQPHAH